MKTTRKQKEAVFDEKANTWRLEDGEVSNRRAGYDFCFSVPKSVSLYLVETGDRTVEQLIHESFKETMLDIEKRMETRVRGKGDDGQVRNEERTTGNLIYASFVHTETRPIDGIPDPHYHIHAFTFNATYDPEEERWKSGSVWQYQARCTLLRSSLSCPSRGKAFSKWLRDPKDRLGILSSQVCPES
jgi:conjugative relaxase-like TrwC/TraI family protein